MIASNLTIPAAHLYLAMRRAEARDVATRKRAARPCLLHRVFPALVPRESRERVARISPTEIVISNPGLLNEKQSTLSP